MFVEGIGIAEGRRFLGGKAVLGAFDNRKSGLYGGNRDEIEAATRELIDRNGTNGFLIGADGTLLAETARSGIEWVVNATRGGK